MDVILIPIPKKGDLHCCDNWRGIALLDVVGKVAARIVQTRLQTQAEQELFETNAGSDEVETALTCYLWAGS